MRFYVIGLLGLLSCSLTSNSGLADFLDFSNSTSISIPSLGLASPYPSSINVSGVDGTINNITVSLNDFSHSYPDDVGAVIVSPSGTAILLFSGPGGGIRASNLNFVFDINAAATLPAEGALTSGTYQPGLFQWDDDFPAPGPRRGYVLPNTLNDPVPVARPIQDLFGENPNGSWNLYVLDSNSGDSGLIAGGWAVGFDFTPVAVPEPNSFALTCLIGIGILVRRRKQHSA